jgi:integrase
VGEVIRRTKGSRFIGYYLRFYDHGRRRQLASHQPSYADAKRMLQEIEARIARGEAGLPDRNRQENPTVEVLIERFLTDYNRPKIKDLTRYRIQAKSVLRHAIPTLGTRPVQQVTAHDISALRDRLQQTLSRGTTRNVLSTLSTMFSWAVQRGLALHNPCRGVERPSTTSSLDFLSAQEVDTLLHGARQRAETLHGRLLYVAICLALHTGIRKGELLGLRRQDIDLTSRRLTIARSYNGTTKSGKTRHLRIPTALCPILSDWLDFTSQQPDFQPRNRSSATGSQLLFPIGHTHTKVATSDAMLGLPKLMKDVGMRKVSQPWHLLRHTYASHYIMSGGNLLALSQILGHSDIKITMIYSHLDPDFLDAELDRVLFRSKA